MAVSDFSPTSAIIGAVSSLAGNVLNVNAQREQREYDRRFWYEQQRYNSPVNQVARLRQAGLNPSLAMQNGAIDSGNISSLPNAHEPPQYDFSPIAQGLQNDLALEQQRRINDAEIDSKHATTENQRIKNRYENQQQLASLFELISRGNLNEENKNLVQKQINRLDKELDWYDRDMESQISLRNSQSSVADAQAEYQRIINSLAPQIQEQTLKNLKKQGAAIDAAARKDNADAVLAAANKFLTDLRAKGVQIENDVAEAIIDARIDEAYYKADEQFWNSQLAGKSWDLGYVGRLFGSPYDLSKGVDEAAKIMYQPPSSRRPSIRKQSKRSKLNPKRISLIE